ncbi:MAG TPA: hypothetical protein VGP08_13930 [Pyrinomonadaceae bacterium]|jgi:hypothetical protein|nr:hypothetical protein [Pyrinomonadaceae bacterium]
MPTIVRRARLGNATEDISYIGNGQMAVLDGYDLLLVPFAQTTDPRVRTRKLFDVRGLAVTGAPRGVAYLATEGLYAFNDLRRRSTILLAGARGDAAGERTIQYPAGFAPDQIEGIDAMTVAQGLGKTDLLLVSAITFGPELESRLEIFTRLGSAYRLAREVMPPDPVGTSFVSGASFVPASSLTRTESGFLVGSDNIVALLDAAGNVILSREIPEALSVEGVAQTETGAIIAADIFAGRLFFFDKKLNRTPEMDRDYRIGLGVASPFGLAWDALFERHLVLGLAPEDGPTAQQVIAVTPDLASGQRAIDLTAQGFARGRRMTYIPEENMTAVAHQTSPRAILLFDKGGKLAETLDVSAVGSPSAIAYIPSRREFAVRITGAANAKTLFVFSRDGKLSRTVDLSATGITSIVALTHFGAASGGEGQLLVLDAPLTDADPVTNRAVITTLDGSLVGDFNTRKSLGVLDPGDVAEITSGKDAGRLSIIDRSSNELVVFSMDAGVV